MKKIVDYVILSQQGWETKIGSNAKNIAQELSKTNRVLYINRALDIQTMLLNKPEDRSFIKSRKDVRSKSPSQKISQINENLFSYTPSCLLLSINGLPDGSIYDQANLYNNKRLANEIKLALEALDSKDFILINDGELFNGFYLKELLKPNKYIYYYRDNFLAVPYWQKHGRRLQSELFAKSDAVLCNSTYLADDASQANSESHFVGQGCDYSLFQDFDQIQLEMLKEKPVIGYVGALNSQRLDVELLENLATSNTNWTWLFVGPKDDVFKASCLNDMANVVFTGPKPQTELAGYISLFDVAMNPQNINPVTIGNYPRKIDEYLYMGKPTVATRTRAMEMFSDYCYLAEGQAEYEEAIHKALNEGSEENREKRIAFAASHSWESSVNEMYNVIEKL